MKEKGPQWGLLIVTANITPIVTLLPRVDFKPGALTVHLVHNSAARPVVEH